MAAAETQRRGVSSTVEKALAAKVTGVVENVERVIFGKHHEIELALVALMCRGHILVEDVPGTGKTVLAKALARSLGCTFRRIQFTPDLLPSDVTGVSIFNQQTNKFEFRPGPVMSQVVLADEINRATPKTQSALLESMDEHQVTVDGTTYQLPEPFLVMATQNPIEYEGTFPLPEAQLDRFFIRLQLGYPKDKEEVAILDAQRVIHPLETIEQVISAEELLEAQSAVREVHIADQVKTYVVAVVNATRSHPDVYLGASPRGSLSYLLLFVGVAMWIQARLTLDGLSITRTLSQSYAHLGDTFELVYDLRNSSSFGKLWLEISEESNWPEPLPGRVLSIGGGKNRKWKVLAKAIRRGRYKVGPIVLRSGDPFGLFPREVRVPTESLLLVYPRVVPLPHWQLPGSVLEGGVLTGQRSLQSTSMVMGIREYRAGDAMNRIHWPSSVRHRTLHVKEFELDKTADLWIYLDLERHWHRGEGEDSTEERAVTVAASIVAKALREHRKD